MSKKPIKEIFENKLFNGFVGRLKKLMLFLILAMITTFSYASVTMRASAVIIAKPEYLLYTLAFNKDGIYLPKHISDAHYYAHKEANVITVHY